MSICNTLYPSVPCKVYENSTRNNATNSHFSTSCMHVCKHDSHGTDTRYGHAIRGRYRPMITLTSQTLRKIDRYPDDDDDGKWMGAALKYLATYDGREYLIKPDVGWPSDSTRERVAAAFYRAIGVRTANVVRAMVDGTPSVAVRIIDGVEPIGDGMYALCKDAALDVVRGVLGAALIGDGDKHAYNFITDGFRAWSIDHGLAFGNDSGKIND